MNRLAAGITAFLILVGGIAQASPATASTTWEFSNAPFTLSDGFGSTANVVVQRMSVTGSTATGYVRISDSAGRYTCYSQDFSATTVSWVSGSFSPCSGSVTFSVDPMGVLSISDSGILVEGRLFTGAGSGSAQGIAQTPVVVPLLDCTASTDVTAQEINIDWTDNPDATTYDVAVSGLSGASITVGPGVAAGADFSALTPGTSYNATVTAKRADGQTVATCTTNDAWTPPAEPVVNSTVPVAAGGLLTVNYSLTDATGVQGIEYRIDSGRWLRPGGVAPVNGTGGSFALSGLAAKDLTLELRTVGADAGGPLTTQSASTPVAFPKPPTVRPTSPGSVVGATAAVPVAAPPAVPVSNVAGTSNGAGTGTNGALAATTGDGGIDAPCLAADGTLYPNQYATVGSQLTMAPNTRGMGEATSFTVVGGTLAPGMQLDRTYGVLFGTTTQAGSFVTTVKARFKDGSTKTSEFTTRVDADPQTLQYAARNIGVVGKATDIGPTTSAPSSGTTYAVVCGELPAGTRFDSATGLITGRPTRPVLLPTPLRVAETSPTGRAAASFIFVVTRAGSSSFSYPAHPHLRAGKRAAIRPTITGPRDFVVFRTSKGKLPKGLRLNSKTGVITGKVRHASRPHIITIVAVTKGGALVTGAPMKITLRR
jgi:hypothetical protein